MIPYKGPLLTHLVRPRSGRTLCGLGIEAMRLRRVPAAAFKLTCGACRASYKTTKKEKA